MKKFKIFTEKQLSRLPKLGYWLEKTSDQKRPNLYSIQNGSCFYIHSMWGEDWYSLLWTCSPTKSKVLNNSNFEYFETIEDLKLKYPNLENIYLTKAPNDL